MSRFEEIEILLRKWTHLYENISRLPVPRQYFYDEITNYGLKNSGSKRYYEFFEYWKQRFENYPNLKVYESENQRGFLQFNNSHGYSNHIKIYLSLSEQYLVQGVNMIFDYLAQNNIGHVSKVAQRDRSDVLVLRIEREEDVPQVLDFINSNSFLKENARPISPFTMRSDNVGITFDGYLSYNMTVAMILDNYFASRKESNNFNSICLDDLKNYINDYYYRTFIDNTNLKDFMELDEVKNEILRIKKFKPYENNINEKVLINYMHIFNAFKTSLNNNANYNDLINDFREYNKDVYDNASIKKFSDALNKNTLEENADEKLIEDYIFYAYNKYSQNKDKVAISILDFANSKYNAITRDNGFRNRFKENLDFNQIMRITNKSPIDYVNRKLEELNKKASLYEQACYATYKKYGYNQTVYAVEKSLNGNFSSFTNGESKLRDKLIERFNEEDVKRSIATILKNNFSNNTENIGNMVSHAIEMKIIDEISNNNIGKTR